MYDFGYVRPRSVEEAVQALRAGDDPKIMAGGQTYIPTLKQRLAMPSELVDLNAIPELAGIKEEGDSLLIGAMTRHATVYESEVVRRTIPALSKLAEGIGDPQVRNRGTLGGSIANNDPSSDYPGAVLGLNATVMTDRREIAGDDFFTAMFETALEEDEIVTAVRFPKPQKAAYAKFPNPASRYAIVGVFVAVLADGQIRAAVTGAGPHVFRAGGIEKALTDNLSPSALDRVEIDSSMLNADMHASPEYRANLIKVMARRAVEHLA